MARAGTTNDLAGIRKLTIVCDDCGRRRIWRRGEIAQAQRRWNVSTVLQLGPRLLCRHCSERGQGGHNATIYVDEETTNLWNSKHQSTHSMAQRGTEL